MTENQFRELSKLYHEDAGFRAAADEDARAALAGKGVYFDAPGEVRLAVDTEDTTHIVFPPDPNAAIADEDFNVTGGVRGCVFYWQRVGGHISGPLIGPS